MATSLLECSLAQLYKRSDPSGTCRGGPAHYIIHGLGREFRWLAMLYAVSLIAAFGLGFNAFQGNTVAGAAQDSLGIDRIWTGLVLAALTGSVVCGGIKRVARVADIVVPIVAISYIGMALIIVLINIADVPAVLVMIVKKAFGFEEAMGGGMGAAGAWTVLRHVETHRQRTKAMRRCAGSVDVVVTHWPPTLHSLHPMCADVGTTELLLNRYFINDEEALVREVDARFWISGHTHMPHQKRVGETTSIGNPTGYRNEGRGPGFWPNRVIEVEPSHRAHDTD